MKVRHEIEKEVALKLCASGWWKDKTPEEIVSFQLFTAQLCMPFGDFQEAMNKALGRSVFTHEFGLNVEGLQQEFLGEREAPTFEEILALFPGSVSWRCHRSGGIDERRRT